MLLLQEAVPLRGTSQAVRPAGGDRADDAGAQGEARRTPDAALGSSPQCGQGTRRVSTSTSCAPRTTTSSSTDVAARTRSRMPGRKTRCFGEPYRVDAPAARTTAETTVLLRLDRDLVDLDALGRLL